MEYLKKLDALQDELIKTLQGLIRIRSVEDKPIQDKPFGKGIHEALMYMLNKGKALGLEVKNVDNYAGHVEIGEGKDILGILAHLDVVPEGSGWQYDPFGGEIVDGKIYGRGTVDDKGPAVAVLYGMKAIKDSGIKLSKRVRLILGTDEESSRWAGIKYYLSKEEIPNFGFTPDSNFPVIHAEMGILIFDLIKKIKAGTTGAVSLKSIKGGNAPNMVPDSCKAVITADDYQDILKKVARFNNDNTDKISTRARGKSLEIYSEGVSAHGAHPERGINAVSILMRFLGMIRFANEDHNEFIEFYNQKIGMNIHGEYMGCYFKDEISGQLIFNVGKITVDEKTAGLTINIRYPVSMKGEEIYKGIRTVTDEYDFGIVKTGEQNPIYLPTDHPVVQILMKVYRKHTNDKASNPIVIGGGTYARAIENAVAFGPVFIGQPSVEHQKDEHIEIDLLMKASKIFADAIYELAK